MKFQHIPSLLDPSGNALPDSEPDPVITAFTKRAIKEAKEQMQNEVDQPVSFLDYGSEFVAQTALIPRRPWLAIRLPIILPPNNALVSTDRITLPDPATDDECPNRSESGSETDHIMLPDSDHNPDTVSDSSPASQMHLPVSDDDEGSDAMDVVNSDEQQAVPPGAHTETPLTVIRTDLDPDSPVHIIFPSEPSDSPMSTQPSIGVFERDPITGWFTPASFSRFPDDLLDEV